MPLPLTPADLQSAYTAPSPFLEHSSSKLPLVVSPSSVSIPWLKNDPTSVSLWGGVVLLPLLCTTTTKVQTAWLQRANMPPWCQSVFYLYLLSTILCLFDLKIQLKSTGKKERREEEKKKKKGKKEGREGGKKRRRKRGRIFFFK